jgi:hypothetical protein
MIVMFITMSPMPPMMMTTALPTGVDDQEKTGSGLES